MATSWKQAALLFLPRPEFQQAAAHFGIGVRPSPKHQSRPSGGLLKRRKFLLQLSVSALEFRYCSLIFIHNGVMSLYFKDYDCFDFAGFTIFSLDSV
jgi:hypothetical protein